MGFEPYKVYIFNSFNSRKDISESRIPLDKVNSCIPASCANEVLALKRYFLTFF